MNRFLDITFAASIILLCATMPLALIALIASAVWRHCS